MTYESSTLLLSPILLLMPVFAFSVLYPLTNICHSYYYFSFPLPYTQVRNDFCTTITVFVFFVYILFSLEIYTFKYLCVSVYCLFILTWKAHFSTSCKAGVLVTHFLSFCLSWEVFNLLIIFEGLACQI